MPGIIFYSSMIYLSGQDILNLTSTFSEDNYRSETLKIDYDIGVDYYDIKNLEADTNLRNMLSGKKTGTEGNDSVQPRPRRAIKRPNPFDFD